MKENPLTKYLWVNLLESCKAIQISITHVPGSKISISVKSLSMVKAALNGNSTSSSV
jgi:hypothetical protein